MDKFYWFLASVTAGVLVIAGCVVVYFARLVKLGPDEVLVITGGTRRMVDAQGKEHEVSMRVCRGPGRAYVAPGEKVRRMSPEQFRAEFPGLPVGR